MSVDEQRCRWLDELYYPIDHKRVKKTLRRQYEPSQWNRVIAKPEATP